MGQDSTTRAKDRIDAARAAELVLEGLREGVLWLDAKGRVRRANPAAAAHLGYPREAMLGLSISELNPSVSPERWRRHWQTLEAEGATVFETRHHTRAGEELPVEISARYVPIEGEPLVCAVVRPLAVKGSCEEILRTGSVAKVSPVLMFRSNRFGRWTWINERWRELTGRAPPDALVDGWAAAVHPDERARVVEGWGEAVRERQPWHDEFRLVGPAGEVWVAGQAAPEAGDEGAYVGALLDVTDQKAAEQALQAAAEAAKAASRSKSEFLASMSHELRTPLNGILGYAQILGRDPSLGDEQREAADKIRDAGEHLLTLINEVLDLSRIEAGRLELEPVDFCLVDTLEGVADMFRVRAEQKGLEFRYLAGTAFPLGARGDERKIRQILLNLLGNAVKFTEAGRVSLAVREVEPGRVQFVVEDTGVGIPEAELEHVFEPFTQVGGARGEGTGLGLAISRQLAEVMGGEIRVHSVVGQGSRFTLEIPLERRGGIEPNPVPERRRLRFEGPARKVLIVDDRPENRMLLVRLLAPLGFEVCEASEGAQALARVAECGPDLVLMDLVMPGVDGFEATRRLRRSESGRRTPVIALSASVFDDTKEKSRAAGCDAFVSKPVRERELFEALDRLLPLEWTFEGDRAPAEDAAPVELVPPPRAVVDALFALAERGQIVAVRKKIDEIEALGPEYRGFARQMRGLAKGFQLQRICDFLGAYRA